MRLKQTRTRFILGDKIPFKNRPVICKTLLCRQQGRVDLKTNSELIINSILARCYYPPPFLLLSSELVVAYSCPLLFSSRAGKGRPLKSAAIRTFIYTYKTDDLITKPHVKTLIFRSLVCRRCCHYCSIHQSSANCVNLVLQFDVKNVLLHSNYHQLQVTFSFFTYCILI